jgi:alpha-glucosidase (family GH31 glycosyl hydrolase)
VFFRNTNAMSPVITYTGDSTSTLSVITTGGNLEIYLMFKGSAQQIISQYQKIIGLPALPPFWALGFQIQSDAVSN